MTDRRDQHRTLQDDRDRHRTLQDDRAALEIDAEDESPLVEGEGAPLAEDSVADQAHAAEVTVTQSLMGGAPIGSVVPSEADKPIDD